MILEMYVVWLMQCVWCGQEVIFIFWGGVFEGGVDEVMVEDVVCWGMIGGVWVFGLDGLQGLQVGQ